MGTQKHPSQRVETTSEPTESGPVAGSGSSDPDTLADLVGRLCRQIHSIADAADRACARARPRKDELPPS